MQKQYVRLQKAMFEFWYIFFFFIQKILMLFSFVIREQDMTKIERFSFLVGRMKNSRQE